MDIYGREDSEMDMLNHWYNLRHKYFAYCLIKYTLLLLLLALPTGSAPRTLP
jgi:hypothetical protein